MKNLVIGFDPPGTGIVFQILLEVNVKGFKWGIYRILEDNREEQGGHCKTLTDGEVLTHAALSGWCLWCGKKLKEDK